MVKKVQGNKNPISCKRDDCITGIKTNALFNRLKLTIFWDLIYIACFVTKLKKTPTKETETYLHLLKEILTAETEIFMSGELRNIYNMTNRWVHAEIILEWFLQGVITQLFGSWISVSSTLAKARTSMLCLMRKAIRIHRRIISCHMSPEIILREWKIHSVCLCRNIRLIFLKPKKREDRGSHFMQHCCALLSFSCNSSIMDFLKHRSN